MKIYTKTGDNLTTSIINKRVYKNDKIVECEGTIDELQASLMVASNYIDKSDVKEIIINIVKDLFNVGTDILKIKKEYIITEKTVNELEFIIDKYQEQLPPLKDFILPGVSISSSYLHLSRTIARRLERRVVAYGREEELNGEVFQYLNRLSDLIFILARYME